MELPQRKLPRLHGYDYSNENYYFVTICTHNRMHLFGSIPQRNTYGIIAEQELVNLSTHFEGIKVDKYVIMPNHIHAIIVIGCCGNSERSRPFPTLSVIVGLYKSGVTKRIHEIQPCLPVWQKSFYDSILHNEKGYHEAWRYIDENPLKWLDDEYYM